MAITDEDRARVAEIAMQALDDIIERYGEDAELSDAVLLYEVSVPDEDNPDERCSHVNARTTTARASVAGGIAQVYANTQMNAWDRRDE